MRPFSYARPETLADAMKLLSPAACAKGGGNDLLDLAKRGVATPGVMVDLARVAETGGGVSVLQSPADRKGWLAVAARTTLAEVASHQRILREFPALADAALEAATPQIRNTATVAGNLLQRPRCAYFRDAFFDCRKRGGTTCPARDGVHDEMAIFGNASCCAVHPSNLATALVALDAEVHVATAVGADGTAAVRTVRAADFFVAPEKDPLREADLRPGEIVTAVVVPAPDGARASAYVEVNQKQSYDWASVACAVVLHTDGTVVRDARVVLGAVAPVPLVSASAAAALRGTKLRDADAWDAAGAAACEGATPLPRNGHKVRQLRAVVRRAVAAAVARIK